MAWPVTLNGRVYNADDFEGTAYVTGMPDAFEDFVTHAASIHSGKVNQSFDLTSTSTARGATISFTVASSTFLVAGVTLSVNKSFSPGQPVRLSHYTGATLDGFLDGTVTNFNPATGLMDFLIGTRVKNSAAAAYGGVSDSWDLSIGGAGDIAPLVSGTDYYSKADADSEFYNKTSSDARFPRILTGATPPVATKIGDIWINGAIISMATGTGIIYA